MKYMCPRCGQMKHSPVPIRICAECARIDQQEQSQQNVPLIHRELHLGPATKGILIAGSIIFMLWLFVWFCTLPFNDEIGRQMQRDKAEREIYLQLNILAEQDRQLRAKMNRPIPLSEMRRRNGD